MPVQFKGMSSKFVISLALILIVQVIELTTNCQFVRHWCERQSDSFKHIAGRFRK